MRHPVAVEYNAGRIPSIRGEASPWPSVSQGSDPARCRGDARGPESLSARGWGRSRTSRRALRAWWPAREEVSRPVRQASGERSGAVGRGASVPRPENEVRCWTARRGAPVYRLARESRGEVVIDQEG